MRCLSATIYSFELCPATQNLKPIARTLYQPSTKKLRKLLHTSLILALNLLHFLAVLEEDGCRDPRDLEVIHHLASMISGSRV